MGDIGRKAWALFRQFEAISGHFRSFQEISGNLREFQAILGNLRPFEARKPQGKKPVLIDKRKAEDYTLNKPMLS